MMIAELQMRSGGVVVLFLESLHEEEWLFIVLTLT